jgi:hypothetical protein
LNFWASTENRRLSEENGPQGEKWGRKPEKQKKPEICGSRAFEEKCHVDMTDSIFASTGITLGLTSAYP